VRSCCTCSAVLLSYVVCPLQLTITWSTIHEPALYRAVAVEVRDLICRFLATFGAPLRRYYLRNIRAFSELEMYAWYCAIGYRNFLLINRSIDRSIYLSIYLSVTECNAVLSSILATKNFFDPETTAFGGLKHLVSVFKMSRVLSLGSVKAIQKEIDMVCIYVFMHPVATV